MKIHVCSTLPELHVVIEEEKVKHSWLSQFSLDSCFKLVSSHQQGACIHVTSLTCRPGSYTEGKPCVANCLCALLRSSICTYEVTKVTKLL